MTNLAVRVTRTMGHLTPAELDKKTLGPKTQSFAQQLWQAAARPDSKPGVASKTTERLVAKTSRQIVPARQDYATANFPSPSAPVGFNALIPADTNATAPTPEAAPAAATTTPSANDVYWAKQPAAVQQLRKIDDPGQRAMLAAQLSAEGYTIDTPVMVWGWDAGKTTLLRQGFGYTWVPSAMQAPVSAAPGITGGAIVPYDPANPPAGSILV